MLSSKFKETLTKIRNKIVNVKFHFDVALSFMTLLNFALLIITASDKLRAFLPFGTYTMVFLLIPVALLSTVLLGWFLDKVVNYQATYYKAQTDRVPQTMEMLERIRNMEQKLDQLIKKLEIKI